MYSSARHQIVQYLTEFEACVSWMYLDSLGLVSTGIGVLLDPYEKYGKELCKTVSWYDKETLAKATDEDVKKEFDMVKSKNSPSGRPVWSKDPATNFASYRAFESITRLRLSNSDINKVVLKIVSDKEVACRQCFGSEYDRYPADVQVVLTQMSYAGGLYARKDKLKPFLAVRNWLGAREYTYLTNSTQGKDGYKKYNACFQRLMLNAHIVESCSKIVSPNMCLMPQNIEEFFGYKNALYVSRWNSCKDVEGLDETIREDDVITGGDITAWLRRQ
jgi:hypothetical protein